MTPSIKKTPEREGKQTLVRRQSRGSEFGLCHLVLVSGVRSGRLRWGHDTEQ